MPVIKASPASNGSIHGVAKGAALRGPLDIDRLSRQADAYLEQVRHQAHELLEETKHQADALRAEYEAEGRAAAEQTVQQRVEQLASDRVNQRVQTLLPALEQAMRGIQQARHELTGLWEQQIVRLAAAIASRVIRRELSQSPGIPLPLIQEALELASGSSRLCIRLSPTDHEALGESARQQIAQFAGRTAVELLADSNVTPGGCVVETQEGRIDQRLEVQLARIEEELVGRR